MATEEETRETTDGLEVQMEAANDLQTQLDSKHSSIKEIKCEARTMDSTGGILKIPEDQVLVEAPSETTIPSEHNLNGMASSLNGHVDKEENMSTEQPHETNQESQEQVETSPEGIGTYQRNKRNEEEVTDSLSHGESASEDITLPKFENAEATDHGQQGFEGHVMNDTMVQEIDNAIEQTVDAYDLDPSKETKDTQPAIMTSLPDDEVLAQTLPGIKSPLKPNVDDFNAIPDTIDGNKETDESTKDEDKFIVEHADEEAKVQDQQSKQADDMDAEVLQEEISESKEPDVPKTEEADEASIDDQGALGQEPALETNASLSIKAEETCHKESYPEEKVIAEHAEEEVKVADQQSKQVDDMDAEVLQEEISENKEPDVPKTKLTDKMPIDEQEAPNQEPVLKTNESLSVKAEEICHESNVVTGGERTPEDDATTRGVTVDIKEEQNQGSVEEVKDAEAVDTEEIVQQSSVAFDETIQDHAATTDPSSDIQHIPNTEPEETKDPSAVEAEEVASQSNMAFSEDAVQDKVIPSEPPEDIQPVQELEQEETKQDDEASDKTNPSIFSSLNQEDGTGASEPHATELAEEAAAFSNLHQEGGIADTDELEEAKEIEATETEEITHQSPAAISTELPIEDNSTSSKPHNDEVQHSLEQDSMEVKGTEAAEIQGISHERTIATSKEDAVEDDGTEKGPSCVSQEVQDAESSEEIKERKVDDVVEPSNVATVDDVEKENNVQTIENIAELQLQGLESEENKNPEPFETEEDFNNRHSAPFNDPDEEVKTTECETENTESTVEIKETEDTKTESIPQESNASISEEPTPEDSVTASETNTRELTIAGSIEAIEDSKDTETEENTDQSNEVFAGEATQGDNILESVSTAHTQPMQELESEEINKAEFVDSSVHQKDDAVPQKKHLEVNPTTCETNVIVSAEVSSAEVSEDQEIVHQSNITQCEEQATEENLTEGEQRILEMGSVQDMKDTEATEPEFISQQNIVSTSKESASEENAAARELGFDDRETQNDGPELTTEHDDMKALEIPDQSSEAIVEGTAQEDSLLASEPANNVQAKELEPEEIRYTVDGETEEASHQTHDAAVEGNWTSEPEMTESSEQMRDTEPTLHDSNVASVEEIETQDNAATEQNVGNQQLQEQESVEFKETEVLEPQGVIPSHNVSSSEEFNLQETVTKEEPSSDTQVEESSVVIEDSEDVSSAVLSEEAAPEEHILATEATVDTSPVQEAEVEESKNIESVEVDDNTAASDLPGEEMDTKVIATELIPYESTTAGVKELNEDVKGNVALAEDAASEEHKPELEEIKSTEPAEKEHNIIETGLPDEEMKGSEAMETETVPHDSNVESIKELAEDDIITASAPDVDIQQVAEQESVEDMKYIATAEHPGETPESIVSTSDELTPTGEITIVTETTFASQPVQSLTDQETEDSKYVKTEESSELSTFSTPEEAVQERDLLKSEPSYDIQQAQELDSTEQTKGTEHVETEDYQKNGVSTLEESTTEVETNVDDQDVQENNSVVEVKENEHKETKKAAQESSELVTEQPFYVQPVQQIELTKYSEDNQLIEAEETSSQSNIVTPNDPTAEDKVANEIDQSVDIDQGHELESVEEIKDIDATDSEETSHTGQAVSLVEQSSESNLSAAELTHGVQQVNVLDAVKEIEGTGDTGGEEIFYEQTDISVDPSPTDNAQALQDYPVESNEENLGKGIDDVISVHEKVKDDIHELAELKDKTSELGETTQTSVNRSEEHDHISTEDTIETSNNTNLDKHDSGQISNVQDNEKLHDVMLQTQVCERSVDTIVIGQQDDAVKSVNLDQQGKEYEEIEKKKEELPSNEQKHDDKTADFIIDTQVESIDAFEAEQTDTGATEVLNDEVTQHISNDSIPTTADAMVKNITEIKEETEEGNGPNNDGTPEVSAKNYNEDVQENSEKDAVVANTSSSEQDETNGEIRNEEVESCLASSLERDLQADSVLSNDQMLENNPIVVPQNDQYRLHRAEKEYLDKVNVEMHAIQESDKVIEGAEEKQEVQNEDNVVRHDESLTTTQKEETSQLHTDEQHSAGSKMDDTRISYAEITPENTSAEPREVENTDEKKGFEAFPEFDVETSNQSDVDHDLSIHHQVEDEKSAATENNGVEAEDVHPKLDMSIVETNNYNNLSITNPLPEHETENASDINQNRQYQEATNADAIENIETGHIKKMETNNTATTEVVKPKEDICDKASGADGVPSDGSLKTSEDTRRNLDVSSAITELKEENMNNEMEDYKLDLPVHPIQDENSTEKGSGLDDTGKESKSPEKALPAEPEEQEEYQVTKQQDEGDMQDPELGGAQKEDQKESEQDYLPVSSFLMNLILGKENDDPTKDSETEVEKKQEETMNDDSSLINSQQEESSVSFPVENMVDEKVTFEQEMEKVEGSEETKEPEKEQSHDVELDIQKSLETDEELKKNTLDLEAPIYQDNAQDENSSKLISTKADDLNKKVEARDFEFDEKSFDTVCQENVAVEIETEKGSLNRNQVDITIPKASQEDALEEVGTELPHESSHENGHDAKAEQTLSLTEPDIGNTAKLPNDDDSIQSPPCTEQEETIETSYVEVRSITEVQVESEAVEKKENQYTITSGETEEQMENLHDDKSKETYSEAISDEQTTETTEPVSYTQRDFAYEKEIPASLTCIDKKESKISNNEVSKFDKALDIPSHIPNLHVNQDKKDESAENQIVMEHKLEDSDLQEEQEVVAQKFLKETEGSQKFMAITEPAIKSNEEQELFDSQVQESGLHVVSPKATSETEENFVKITKPEFSTDEEHSPKVDETNKTEEKTCDEKTKAEEETNNNDEITMKVEERGAEQKVSHKKHNILSGVGSKVKHQLAKVKKAIIGKPGHTKSESPKS
ncbi:extracellular matrix-binding protein ebh [Oryza brachyantha]|uniref:Uncharacterized protein n=1 Tax=Oryza brachyantha TaxID=4533 RepID=J3L9B8_ORYBR|nr:extracellular matrix-binding protein ebh [Oryza brachyantha]